MLSTVTIAYRLALAGFVQGVGFRPFVFRLARECRLVGWIRNTSAGLTIHVEGSAEELERFLDRIVAQAPVGSKLEGMTVLPVEPLDLSAFRVLDSRATSLRGTRVPRDRAVCPACLDEMGDPVHRRYEYPFTNCTACGPRYSIVEDMPYDRPATTMATFVLCSRCDREYRSPSDRRFHAEPTACPACGPRLRLITAAVREKPGKPMPGDLPPLADAVLCLCSGGILALKGIGGLQWLCRANDEVAIAELRRRKRRPTKPLAVMVPSVDEARRWAKLNGDEASALISPENPIVLLERSEGCTLPPILAPRVATVGLFLPTTPLHALLLRAVDGPLVVTSGNVREKPIPTLDAEIEGQAFSGAVEAALTHDRPIARALDDSVVRVIAGHPVPFRVGRGLAPLPLPALERWARGKVCPPALAVGGQQKVAVALWNGSQAVLGQHVGDMNSLESRARFDEVVRDLRALYRVEDPELVCDRHPDYFTTRWVEKSSRTAIQVQHHHAHAVSCMVDRDLLDREVLAFAWDGTGMGTDGTIWGGEVLRASIQGSSRLSSLFPFGLVGGDAAVREPGRIALALLAEAIGPDETLDNSMLLSRLGFERGAAESLLRLCAARSHVPLTTSMGRLFDGVAAILLGVREVSFEGEGAGWLESAAESGAIDQPFSMPTLAGSTPRGDWRPMIREMCHALQSGVKETELALRFHVTLVHWACRIAADHPDLDIVLSGGCFQNRLLAERLLDRLGGMGRAAHGHRDVPPNDGGLAVGQLAVAMSLASGVRVSSEEC